VEELFLLGYLLGHYT